MLKLLLVDDEPLIRKNLISSIDWKEHDIEIIAEAGDGVEALDIIKNYTPDIVILDVHMPRMDGISLAEKIMDLPNKPNIIFLSGIKEFEYVQKAMLFDAHCYLLKPIRSKDLSDMVEKVKIKIWREKYKEEYTHKLKKQIAENLAALREQFLNQLIRKEMNIREIQDKLAFFEINLQGIQYVFVLIEVEELKAATHSEEEKQILKFTIRDLANKVINRHSNLLLFTTYEETLALIIADDKSHNSFISDICTSLMNVLSDVLDVRVSMGVSRPTTDISRLSSCFKESQEALTYQFFQSGSSIIHISDIQVKEVRFPEISINYEKLSIYLKQGNTEKISKLIVDIFSQIRDQPTLGHQYVITVALRIASNFFSVIHEFGYSMEEVFPNKYNPYFELLSKRNIDELQDSIENVSQTISLFISNKQSHKNIKSIYKAKAYIEANFTNSELTLKSVSEAIDLSYTYFSHLFKQLTNESFSDYVNKFRLEQAKKMLETSELRVFEVAYAVGYKDPNYFSQSFKIFFGISPTEYKKKTNK